MLKVVSLLISLAPCTGEINHLNGSEYTRMPPLFHLDPYKECFQDGEYCSVKMQLVSNQHSNLLKIIEEYSAHKTHFNHTVLNYGICVTKTCKHFLQTNLTLDPRVTLEGCLNSVVWNDYRLQVKLIEEPSCHKPSENNERIGFLDIIIAVLLGTVSVLNLIGNLRELTIVKDNSLWSSFSLRRNWLILTGPSRITDPRMKDMKAFNGIRSMTSMIVISVHSLLPFFISSANPRDWEEGYNYIKYVGTGSQVVQTFFVMSGFLMAHHMVIDEGETRDSYRDLIKRILLRWLRLAPPYLTVVALTMTCLRFLGSGPLWHMAVRDHIESCRANWWLVPLNVINYADHTQCFIEYWYIAAEMQLSILGLLVFGVLRGRARWWILGFLLVVGLIAPAFHTWLQDLDGWMLLTPEISRKVFVQSPTAEYAMDPTFDHVYKRGHTNVAVYVIGAAMGLLVCDWQRHHGMEHRDKLKMYRFIFWSTLPLMLATVLAGSVFFGFEGPAPLLLRVGYSLLGRVIFGGCVAVLLAGLTLKIENVYRSILGWQGWMLTARLSYCAYAVHVAIIRLHAGSQMALSHVSVVNTIWLILGTELATFFVAIPLWLFVDAPMAGVIKHLTRGSTREYEKPVVNDDQGSH